MEDQIVTAPLKPLAAQTRPRSTAAARARLCRLRRKSGIIVVPIAIAEFEVLGALIDRSRLSEDETRDPACVAGALAQIIEEWTIRNKL
jgi:hypothetical protein